jgi:dipeptidyl-peptidase-3
MKNSVILGLGLLATVSISCERATSTLSESKNNPKNSVIVDTFADIQVLKYDLPGWEELTPKQKELILP